LLEKPLLIVVWIKPPQKGIKRAAIQDPGSS